jgi:hypothetical protein
MKTLDEIQGEHFPNFMRSYALQPGANMPRKAGHCEACGGIIAILSYSGESVPFHLSADGFKKAVEIFRELRDVEENICGLCGETHDGECENNQEST